MWLKQKKVVLEVNEFAYHWIIDKHGKLLIILDNHTTNKWNKFISFNTLAEQTN